MNKTHVSASAIKNFECPVRFATSYDEDRAVTTRNEFSDVGVLIHAVLEAFRDPENWTPESHFEDNYETFEGMFEEVCKTHIFAEDIKTYRRAKKMLPMTYQMTHTHPTVPLHLAVPRAVEQQLLEPDGLGGWQLWKLPSWPLPMKGSIDFVATIEAPKLGGHILFIGDTKSGRVQTHEELTQEEIAPRIYALYARRQLVPHLEAQGLKIVRIILGWDYVSEGVAIPMDESDFDHDETEKYIANISQQIVNFQTLYNEKMEELATQNVVNDDMLNAWFSQYEKPNRYCSYCPRSNVCQTFNRLLQYNATISLSGEIDWVAFWEEYKNYQAIEKASKNRLERMKETVKVYSDQEGLDAIPIGDTGYQFKASPQSRDKYDNLKVADALGVDFVIANAKLSKESILEEYARVASLDPDRAEEVKTALALATTLAPYSRPVTITKAPKEKQ